MSAPGFARGQTTIDYAVGVSLFLITVVGVFAFVPGMLTPFAGDQDGGQAADRVASSLATDLLGSPREPYVLDGECTRAFFDGLGDDDEADCRYGGSDPAAAVGLGSGHELSVTLERDGEASKRVGPSPSAATDGVYVARRAVRYEGRTHRLVVRVW